MNLTLGVFNIGIGIKHTYVWTCTVFRVLNLAPDSCGALHLWVLASPAFKLLQDAVPQGEGPALLLARAALQELQQADQRLPQGGEAMLGSGTQLEGGCRGGQRSDR